MNVQRTISFSLMTMANSRNKARNISHFFITLCSGGLPYENTVRKMSWVDSSFEDFLCDLNIIIIVRIFFDEISSCDLKNSNHIVALPPRPTLPLSHISRVLNRPGLPGFARFKGVCPGVPRRVFGTTKCPGFKETNK